MTDVLKENEDILKYLKTLNILCVDDDEATIDAYESLFQYLVKDFISANNGEDGFKKFQENKIDFIITDYHMPILDGLEMVKKIRAIDKDVPIILVTAIDDKEVIINALNFRVNHFIKKPIHPKQVINVIIDAAKMLLANQHLKELQQKRLQELEAKESYSTYQEDLAFDKELNILRNDFYYQMLNTKDDIYLLDFLYQPLDIVSGDAYSARKIDENQSFYLMIDGMGKGLSASLTAMVITTFINHTIDKMIKYNDFDLYRLTKEALNYIRPVLLDEEALSIDFFVINNKTNTLSYAKFAMPVMLLQDEKGNVIRLQSNNLPMSKYLEDVVISTFNIKDIIKILIYSDGLVENTTCNQSKSYLEFIEKDFYTSFTKDDFKHSFMQKINQQEDDITLIYLHKLKYNKSILEKKVFETSLEDVDNANEWYINLWEQLTDNSSVVNSIGLVFNELFMNAYEHGNLGIDATTKNKMLDEDIYFDTLLEKEQMCDKQITVEVQKIPYNNIDYIITIITDEGEGFDTQILSKIFRNSQTFNGRGVFVSRKNSLGIYYNRKGNQVLFLNKVPQKED
ncbi:Chemotaxis regulator-transmits chemoreceptor signals to flagelllar motor components CheY [hydrothermal vent metagenome]|uniref:Chemotaxis regulator-transmits chemoreceptor signals to flagelllar motor components CheY n=1 Tax=hydrothermal vent metagenome TaxID=652676 RepID=A0A1W1D3R2_9ZZZZ